MSPGQTSYRRHLITAGTPIREALERLDRLAADAVLFVVDDKGHLLGSLTDGDVRRGLIGDLTMENGVDEFMNPDPHTLDAASYGVGDIRELRETGFTHIPIVDGESSVADVLNLRLFKTRLPVDAVIMAGGRGKRLQPMTDDTPKPLLEIGEKPILEHNIDRLARYGITDLWITIGYLGEQIRNYFGDGSGKGIDIRYVEETEPLGTAGSLSLIDGFNHDQVLLMNSDLLTTIDLEEFFLHFEEHGADLAVAAVPYSVDVPYAVLETSDQRIVSFREKPTFTYYSNGGIYLMKRELAEYVPENEFYDITDLIETMIDEGKKVVTYPVSNYWLDIGKPEDYRKALEDIKHLRLDP